MIKSTSSDSLKLLRFVALLALVLFSFQMISDFSISEDQQLEIVDIDLDDDTEEELDEIDLFGHASYSPTDLNFTTTSPVLFEETCLLFEQTRSELHSPPPEGNFVSCAA